MLQLVEKLLLLGAARRWAKRPTAAAETAALALVLARQHLGRGAKRDRLLAAAHVIFLPAAVIKTVRLVRCLATGAQRRRGTTPGSVAPLALPPTAASGLPTAPLVVGAEDGTDPLTGAAAAAPLLLPSFRHHPPPLPRAVPRSEWGLLQIPDVAHEYGAWVRCLRNVLVQQGLRSLPAGLDPDGLELTRYLLYGGLLAASRPAEAARAVAATAVRVRDTLSWRATYPFMEPQELKSWEDVTWWAGPDPDGTLWLHLHLTRAMTRCSRGEGRAAVQAVISQLEYGTRVLMAAPPAAAGGPGVTSDGEGDTSTTASRVGSSTLGSTADGGYEDDEGGLGSGATAAGLRNSGRVGVSGRGGGGGGGGGRAAIVGPGGVIGRMDDRIRVLVVGSGSNVRQVVRMFPLFREFARLVQRHYPGRLRAMYLADLPRGLRMGLGAVLNLMPHETRQKVKVCRIDDLPDCISGALAARDSAAAAAAALAATPAPGLHHYHRSPLADAHSTPTALATATAASGAVMGLAAAACAVAAALSSLHGRGASEGAAGRGAGVAAAAAVGELRVWLLRVWPAVLMAAMACLTYKSLLARI